MKAYSMGNAIIPRRPAKSAEIQISNPNKDVWPHAVKLFRMIYAMAEVEIISWQKVTFT
jgi:hypothetical protein